MPTNRKKAALIFTRFAQASSNDFCSSLFSATLIQLTSYLHSICLLLISAFSLDSLQQYQFLPIVRNFVCLIALVPSFDNSRLVSMTPLFDTICLCYFLSWIVIIGLGLYYTGTMRNRETLPRFSHALSFAFLFHSRVLFFPVQYFLLMSISYANTTVDKSGLFIQERIPITIILSIFNILIAFCKEISFYRITPDKNAFACKNNLVSLIILAHKTTVTFLLAFFSESVVISRLSAVLNLIIFTISIFAIYFKLPFYQMPLNQVSMAFSGISLVFSMLFVLKSFGIVQGNFTVELILYIVLVLVVIVLMQLLQNLKLKILHFEYRTVEQAVHLPILLKSARVSSYPFPKLQKKFPRGTISYLGILKLQASNLEKSESQQKETVDECELYTLIIHHLSCLLQKNPDSVLLRVCMARIYLKKLKTGVHAIKLLKSIMQCSQSVAVKNSVEAMLTGIEQSFLRSNDEEPAHLNILNYFKYRDLANELKQKIQAEVSNHTEFWRKLTQEKVDIFRMINISEGLNNKFLNIKKLWNDYSQAFGSYFGVSVMLYGVYLQIVRALPHQGWPIISNYFHHFRNKSMTRINRILSVLEGSAAVVVGSIENDKLGIVIDASSSVKSLFSIAKEKLIYQKVDILMPNFIARRHDEFILSSHKCLRLNLNSNMTSIGKTIEGDFFTLKLNLKAFPFLKSGVCVVAFLQKTTEEEATFVVGNGGVILDWSKKIEDYFEIDRMSLNKLKLQQFSSEFDEALSAFDIYSNNIEESEKDHFDIVQQIYKKYTEGTRMSLADTSLKLDQYVHERQYFVRIEPMFIAGNFYKLVKLRDASSMAKLAASPKKNKLKIDDSFADNFPETSEKLEITQMINKIREKRDSLQVESYKEKTESATYNLNESDTCQIPVQHGQENLLQNKKTVNDKSSTEEPLGFGLRISKTLDEVFNNEKMRPTTRLSIVIVYFAIIAVAIMTSIDYILADWSIEELRSGIVIRNIGNNRLAHSIQAWQYALLIYSVYAESEWDFIKDKLYQHTMHILEQNEILKANLQDLPDQRIINIFFQRSVTLYDSVTQTVFKSEDMNGLAATNILAAENLMVAKYTSDRSTFEAIKVLRESPELIFIVNNTANDYFLVSEQELDDVETIIDSMIARNQQLLKITLSLENVSLILVIFLLVVVVKVVVASHSKAFKAIISIHPQIVQKRLNDLKAFNNHLHENIDTRKFGDNLGFYLETLDKGKQNSQVKLFRVRHSADKLVYRKLILYLMRYLIITLFFGLGVTGIFIYSFTTAQQSFNIVDIYNDKLANIQEIGHRINSILSTFCHLTLFYNRTDLPLWNEIPRGYITENLQALTDANSVLLSSLIVEQIVPVDPVFESFLKNDVCTFVVDQIDDYSKCVEATSDAPGLLNLNSKYIQQAKTSIDNFLRAPTQENGQALFQSFGDETSNDIFTLKKCYEFLTIRLFAQLQYEVELQKTNRLIIYIGNLAFIFLMTLLIHLAPITKFRSIDIALRRVLKIIPYEMIRNNKGCGFFLAKEFEKEIEGIKRYL